MKNFQLIQKNINVRPFLAELAQNEDYWSTQRARMLEVQRETLNINLRSGVSEEGKLLANCHEVVNTAIYDFFPFTTSWAENFAKEIGKLSRMMIVSLQPQGRVYPHMDSGEYYNIRNRYHLVLQSKGGSKMISGNEKQIFNTGELWWFNNKETHEAFNQSAHPRIHIIFDIVPKDNFHLIR